LKDAPPIVRWVWAEEKHSIAMGVKKEAKQFGPLQGTF
jgi:hypothetical protein